MRKTWSYFRKVKGRRKYILTKSKARVCAKVSKLVIELFVKRDDLCEVTSKVVPTRVPKIKEKGVHNERVGIMLCSIKYDVLVSSEDYESCRKIFHI